MLTMRSLFSPKFYQFICF